MKSRFFQLLKYSVALTALPYFSNVALTQALEFENLVNTASEVAENSITEEIESAIELPAEAVTPEALEEMKQRFRLLNPGTMDLKRAEDPNDDASDDSVGTPTRVVDPGKNAPFWSAGKLSFKKNDGKTYRCSAQYSDALKVILTAAHCVYDAAQNEWHGSFSFARAYDEGKSPQVVGWKCASIYSSYYKPSKNYAYDYAFIQVNENDEKAPLKLTFGIPTDKSLVAIGYPKNFGAGKQMYQVEGKWASVSGGIVTMSDNPMRSGNSGGAWFTKFEKDGGVGKNLVISLNSHHIIGNETDENGPLFTEDTNKLFEHVRDGCK